MTKRIVSGIFILIALGALGVILAGALTSGEQLIVRFLIAVIVAALGLYVISDLRLQADDDAAALSRNGTRSRLVSTEAPPNSTAAFMARVTGSSNDDSVEQGSNWPDSDDLTIAAVGEVGAAPSSTTEPDSAVVEGAESPVPKAEPVVASAPDTVRSELLGAELRAPTDEDIGVFGEGPLERMDLVGNAASTAVAGQRLNGHHLDEGPNGSGAPAATRIFRPEHRSDGPSDEDRDSIADWPMFDSSDDGEKVDSTGIEETAIFEYSDVLEADYQWPVVPSDVEADPVPDPDTDAGTDPGPGTDPVSATGLVSDVGLGADAAPTGDDDAPIGEPAGTDIGAEGLDTADEADPAVDEVIDLADDRSVIDLDQPIAATTWVHDLTETDHRGSNLGSSAGAIEQTDGPLAPIIDLRTSPVGSEANIQAAVKAGEIEVIATLIEQGMLSTTGPISDRDVRTMIYVAFTSHELRKLLRAGGMPGSTVDLDLGPVELHDRGPMSQLPAPEFHLLSPQAAKAQLG